MNTGVIEEVLRPVPRDASAIWPGAFLSVFLHGALLSAQVDLPNLLGPNDVSADPTPRLEARLVRLAPPPAPMAAVTKPAERPRPAPRIVAAASPVAVTDSVPRHVPIAEPIEKSPEPVVAEREQAVDSAPPELVFEPPAVAAVAPTEIRVEPARYDADYLDNPRPVYPRLARKRGQEGEVLLEVAVATDGRPLKTEVVRSSGFSLLDSAARRAVAGWRFVPARRGPSPVASTVRVPIRFRLNDPV